MNTKQDWPRENYFKIIKTQTASLHRSLFTNISSSSQSEALEPNLSAVSISSFCQYSSHTSQVSSIFPFNGYRPLADLFIADIMQFAFRTLNAFVALILMTPVIAVPLSTTADTADTAAGAVAWADPQDCHRFYECPVGGKPVLKTCGPGTAFQASTSVCDYEHLVESCWRH